MKFWKHLKKVFSSSPTVQVDHQEEEEEGEKVLLHEVIERTPEEKAYYEEWLDSAQKPNMLHWIHKQYEQFAHMNCNNDQDINFLMIPSVNGWIIHYQSQRWDADHFVSLFDYFKKFACEELGYRCHVSDIQSVRKGNKVRTTQRHYLKPPYQFGKKSPDEKFDQLYGNIMICLCLENERINMLKLSATHYNDHKYNPPKEFSDLVEKICDV